MGSVIYIVGSDDMSSSASDGRLAGSVAEAGVGILDQFSHDVTEELCVGGAVVEVATIVAGWRNRIEETKEEPDELLVVASQG